MGDVFEAKPSTTVKPAPAEGSPKPDAADHKVDDDLKQFVGEDGKLDTSKIAQSYRELNKKFTQVSQDKSTLERAYEAVAGKPAGGESAGDTGTDAEAGRISLEDLVSDANAAITGGVKRVLATEAAPIVQAVMSIAHPETAVDPETGGYKDPEFVTGLQRYAATLPLSIRANLDKDFQTADWVIRNYKRIRGASAGAPNGGGGAAPAKKAQELESAAAARKSNGTKRTKQEVIDLMKKPKEYAKVADEISEQYDELD